MRFAAIFVPSEWKAIKGDNNYLRSDGSISFLGNFNANKYRIENIGQPENNSDVASLQSVLTETKKCAEQCERDMQGHITDFNNFRATSDQTLKQAINEVKTVLKNGKYLSSDGSIPLTGNINANKHKIENIANPVSNTDAANLQCVLSETLKCTNNFVSKLNEHVSEFRKLKTSSDQLDRKIIELEAKISAVNKVRVNDFTLCSGFTVVGKSSYLVFTTSHSSYKSISDIDAFTVDDGENTSGAFIFKNPMTCIIQLHIKIENCSSTSVTLSVHKNSNVIGNKYLSYSNDAENRYENFEFIEDFNANEQLRFSLLTKTMIRCSYHLKLSNLGNINE